MAEFHERLRQLREDKGVSQAEVAQAIGVAKSTMAKYDRGERQPNFAILLKIAKYFNVTVDYLLNGKLEYEGILRGYAKFLEDDIIEYDADNEYIKINNNELKTFCKTMDLLYSGFKESSDDAADASFDIYYNGAEQAIEKYSVKIEQEVQKSRHTQAMNMAAQLYESAKKLSNNRLTSVLLAFAEEYQIGDNTIFSKMQDSEIQKYIYDSVCSCNDIICISEFIRVLVEIVKQALEQYIG